MKRGLVILSGLIILLSWNACGPKADQKTEEALPSALENAAEGDIITGDALTDDYIKILCRKYEQCEIMAFQNRNDCHSRIREVLTQDSKWQALRLDKKALKQCLQDFEDFACESFTQGKSPESCQKL